MKDDHAAVPDRAPALAGACTRRPARSAAVPAVVVAVVAAFAVAGCGSDGARHRVFPVRTDVLCTAEAALDPLTAVLRGSETDPEGIWLEASDGSRITAVWPATVTLRFAPQAQLYGADGEFIAQDGDVMLFSQTPADSAAGTPDDPYILDGLWADRGCYVRAD